MEVKVVPVEPTQEQQDSMVLHIGAVRHPKIIYRAALDSITDTGYVAVRREDLERLAAHFKSCNSIEVERATITADIAQPLIKALGAGV